MVDELNSQSFFDSSQGAAHPDLFQEPVIEPPERFYIADRIEGFRRPRSVTLCQRDLYGAAVAKSRLGCPMVVLEKSRYSYRPKLKMFIFPVFGRNVLMPTTGRISKLFEVW